MSEWQRRWDAGVKGRHLFRIKKEVTGFRVQGGSRRDEVVMTRLRLGHCALNGTLRVIGKHGTGLCEVCQEEEETVEHVLLRCEGYSTERDVLRDGLERRGVKEFSVRNILGCGSRGQVGELLVFLKGTGLYYRI